MRVNKTRAILVLLWVFISSDLFASGNYERFQTMTVSNGLNNNTVYDVIRGEKGFIWFSTDIGVSRYDGYHFRNYPYVSDFKQSNGSILPVPQSVSKIHCNADGLIFLQLLRGGMACFDSNREIYLPVRFQKSLGNKKVNGIYVSDDYILYMATNQGLFSSDVKRTGEGKDEEINIVLSEVPLVKGNIAKLCGDGKGNLFFATNSGQVFQYSMGTHRTKMIDNSNHSPISCLFTDQDHLWISRKWGMPICFDYNRGTSRTLSDSDTSEYMRLSDTYVTGITRVDDLTYYFSTWNGLFRLKFVSRSLNDSPYTIEYVTQKDRIDQSVIENKMTNLFWDDSQNMLWITTFGGGVMRTGFNQDIYGRLIQQLNTGINGMVEDAKGYVWLATERKGLWKSSTNPIMPNTVFVPWTNGVSANEGYQIYKDKNGNFWLGDEHAGMVYVDPMTDEVRRYQFEPSGVRNFSGIARQFCLDSRDRLWIVTTEGVLLFDNKTEKCELVLKYTGEIKDVFAVTEDKEGNIWLGTDIGLKRIHLQSGKIELIGDYEQQIGLETSAVTSIYVNGYNQIFVAYTDKMLRIDGREKDKVETLFSSDDGLESRHVFCMIDDNSGNTWVGHNSGIMTIRNDHTLFYNYLVTGYYSQVCRLRDGRLLWTDSKGLIFFDPLVVKNRQGSKPLLLTDLWVNDSSVVAGQEVNGQIVLSTSPGLQEKFVFNADNTNFRFYFSDMQYGMMQRKIAYRIDPDDEWKISSLEDGVHYNHLSSGKYTLQVKLVYPDASEGDVLEIPIVVKAHWWGTAWAWVAYLLILGGIGVVVYRGFIRRGKRLLQVSHGQPSMNAELSVTKMQLREGRDADEIRNVIFTRFMQELHMPLSMIISPLKEVLQEKELSKGLTSKMLVAYRNSMGMLNACDQVMNIIEYVPFKGRTELASYSITKLIDAFVFSMNEFLRVHPIEFQYEKKVKKDLEVWIEKKSIELVLKNLFYNAFLHIRHSGVVALILQDSIEDGIHYCSVSVVDNGKSPVKRIETLILDKEAIDKADSSEVEVGFSMMQDILERHHGIVSIEDLKGGGTKVQVKWPIEKVAFEQDENVVFIDSEIQNEVPLYDGSPVKTTMDMDNDLIMSEESVSPIEREKKTILVVEDYQDIRIYLKVLFEKEYNVLLAANGEEGVDIARKELPDLILCDVMMPLKDGFQCCKELKEGLDTCHIPFVLLTAKVEEDDIIRGLEIGADDYILKPFTPKILKVKVKNLIEGRMNLKRMYTKLLVTPPAEGEAIEIGTKSNEIEDPFISTVVKIIEENIQEPDFNVKKLASDLNMSQPTLYRKIKQSTDFTIIELIRGVRMRKAATLLKQKLYPVQEVAEMVGYNDIPTFRKHFVDTYGTTPSTYADSGIGDKI